MKKNHVKKNYNKSMQPAALNSFEPLNLQCTLHDLFTMIILLA